MAMPMKKTQVRKELMLINLKGITFVRKDKTLLNNPHKTIMQEDKTGYVYEDNRKGVAIIPYRMGTNGREVLIRDEYTPIHDTMLSIITGRMDADDDGWRGAARRELLEEAGILAEPRYFSEIGEIIAGGFYKNADVLCIVDVTGLHQGKPTTDGSIFEKKSTNIWVPIHELVRMIREPRHDMDSYLMSAISKLLVCWGYVNKSEEDDLFKSKKGEEKPGHKYLRREGSPGQYKYIYTEPKEKGPKKEDEKKGKGGLMEQLAALIGKKQGPSEEKAPKKQLPFQEFRRVPEGIPDFTKGITAEQWISKLESRATQTGIGVGQQIFGSDVDGPTINNVNKTLRVLNITTFSQSGNEDIAVVDKKLSPVAQNDVRKAIAGLSGVYEKAVAINAFLNSGKVEKIFQVDMAKKISANAGNIKIADKFNETVEQIKDAIKRFDDEVGDYSWLQGSDPRIDFMMDEIYKSVDTMMKLRDRFVKNGFRFYLDHLIPAVESLKDAEEIHFASKMIESFGLFISDSMRSSAVSYDMKAFANQWNVKEKGIYDGAMRTYSHAVGKVVDKVRDLEAIDENIMKNHLSNIAKNSGFAFLSMNVNNSLSFYDSTEKAFAYIDMHGLDKYFRDSIFAIGGFLSGHDVNKGSYQHFVELLTRAKDGVDIYSDEDSLQSLSYLPPSQTNTFEAAMNTMLLLNKDVPIVSKEAAFIKLWSNASHGSTMSNAIEQFVEENGIDRGTYVNYHVASNRVTTSRNVKVREALSDAVSRVYENTQRTIQDAPRVLYRGNGNSEIKSAASSWTEDKIVAERFGKVISEAEVPAKAILLANSWENEDYWAYSNEREYVVVPGLLTPKESIKPRTLSAEEVQKIRDDELDRQAEAYEED